jgi:hypothetical protein
LFLFRSNNMKQILKLLYLCNPFWSDKKCPPKSHCSCLTGSKPCTVRNRCSAFVLVSKVLLDSDTSLSWYQTKFFLCIICLRKFLQWKYTFVQWHIYLCHKWGSSYSVYSADSKGLNVMFVSDIWTKFTHEWNNENSIYYL